MLDAIKHREIKEDVYICHYFATGVYELCVDTLLPGKIEQWTHRHLMEGLKARCKFSEPVGIWTGEVGPLSTGEISQLHDKSFPPRLECCAGVETTKKK